jgi:hypothetical protein
MDLLMLVHVLIGYYEASERTRVQHNTASARGSAGCTFRGKVVNIKALNPIALVFTKLHEANITSC